MRAQPDRCATMAAIMSRPSDPSAPTPAGSGAGLTALERDVLAFEADWARHAGAREEAIRARFGLGVAEYHRLLNALLDRPEAEAEAPVLVRRLRRQRRRRQESRQEHRSTRRLSAPSPTL